MVARSLLVFLFVTSSWLAPPARAARAPHDRVADTAERVVPAVVNVATQRTVPVRSFQSPFFSDPFFRHFFGDRFQPNVPRERRDRSLGSGVIVRAEGIVVTNHHVVQHADEIRVTLKDGRELDAEIVGSDKASDVAVLRLRDAPKDLPALAFGDSDRVRLGETVLAVGNPFGVGQTVTMGIVSAKGRANVGIVEHEDFIQTDAAINPGNSGGALVNLRGELVGINTAILSRSGGYQGIGFAIPSNLASRIVESLLEHGRVDRGWLGVGIQDLTRELRKAFGLGGRGGVLITEVSDRSPAKRAGFEPGDVLVEFNGDSPRDAAHLRNLVADAGSGGRFVAVVVRDSQRMTLRGALGERETDTADEGQSTKGESFAGLRIAPVDDTTRQRFRLSDSTKGVVVTGVQPGSPAADADVKRGDVIVSVGRRPTPDARSFRAAWESAADKVLVRVLRKQRARYVVIPKKAAP